jgi:tRNA(adenine34) deaminase
VPSLSRCASGRRGSTASPRLFQAPSSVVAWVVVSGIVVRQASSDSNFQERTELMTSKDVQSHMARALSEAEAAAKRGEVPIGALVVSADGRVLASAGNRTRELNDPTAHAEILAIRAACTALADERLVGCSLYVTLEPCPMCATAISFARVKRLYYAASDPKGGGIEQGARIFSQPTCHHVPEIYPGLAEAEAGALLKTFFAQRRD